MNPISLHEMATVYIMLSGVKKPSAEITKAKNALAQKISMTIEGISQLMPARK